MTRSTKEPEFTLEEKSARMFPQWDHSRVSSRRFTVPEQESLRRLYGSVHLVIGMLDAIQDSLRELEQSLGDTE